MIFDVSELIQAEAAAFRKALDAEAQGNKAAQQKYLELADSYAADRAEDIRQARVYGQ